MEKLQIPEYFTCARDGIPVLITYTSLSSTTQADNLVEMINNLQ
jgi:hypothetical protein